MRHLPPHVLHSSFSRRDSRTPTYAIALLGLIALVALIALSGCRPAPRIPDAPTLWVTDAAGMLSPTTAQVLDTQLKQYEDRTGHQVIVWTARKQPKGMSIESYCLLLFNTWGIGRHGSDDGVVLFVFAEDRKLRIQVGTGLERKLTDRESARIINDVIGPRMARGEPDAAMVEGVAAMLAALGAP